MRKKTILAWVLAFLMFFTSGLSQFAYAANEETLATGLTEGTYTDTTADANSKYEYTITGSDGSVSTVTVDAQDIEEDGDNSTPVAGDTFKPEITWKRTEEYNVNTNGTGGLVTGLAFTKAGDDSTYPKVFWDWDAVKNLTVSDDMTVWDYGTEQQYSGQSTASEISAATWVNRNSQGQKAGWSTNASVRKFQGVFEWPAGYDLDDTGKIISVNDEKYSEIYQYVENDEELKEAFGGKTVLPANDDIYVFMHTEEELLTKDNYLQHMVFWTGTSGKGVWSKDSTAVSNGNAYDWDRTVPATYNDVYAIRAFYGTVPTLSTKNEAHDKLENIQNLMNQSDTWYSFADTDGISTVLKNNYPDGITAGTKVYIDIYCFDNDGVGGMDELEFELTKRPLTSQTVEVRYWLDTVGETTDENYLGNSYMNAVLEGTKITLVNGTDANQLDYKKALAISKAAHNVNNGIQINELIVTKNGSNIVNVVYTKVDNYAVTIIADSKECPYINKEYTVPTYKVYMNGNELLENNDGTYTTPAGHFIQGDLIITTAQGTLPGIYNNNINYSGMKLVLDAKNENVTNAYTFTEIQGKLTITYAPDSVDYTYDFGVNNFYENTLNDVELEATVTESSDEVTVDGADVTYTPSAADIGDRVDLTLTFTGDYKVTKTINFIPATNVMYEENLIKLIEDDANQTSNIWKSVESEKLPTVGDNESTVYGFTEAEEYAVSDSFSNNSYHVAKLTLADGATIVSTSNAAEFTFTGTGFDLISECGTDTGMLLVKIERAETGKNVKVCIIDTYFTGNQADDEDEGISFVTGKDILDYQVPVFRKLDLPYGNYKVTVYGYLSASAGVATASTYSLCSSVNSTDEIVKAALEECGFDDIDFDDVEVSFMDENSVLNGGTGVAETGEPATASYLMPGIASYTAKNADEADTTVTANVYLDGFRVYNPLEEDTEIYKTNKESGVKYASVYDFIENSINEIELDDYTDNAFVYVEYDGNTDVAAISEYKVQGPQNEVYLAPRCGIAFALENYTKDDVVQVAMKALGKASATAELLDETAELTTATEMYYEVTPVYDEDIQTWVVGISNSQDSEGILSLSGLKISKHIQPMANAATGNKLIEKLEKSAEAAFEPEYFVVTAKGNTVKSGRNIALSVQSSTDDVANVRVEVLDPLGDIINELGNETLTPTNKKAVSNGKAQYYKYSYTFKTKGREKGTYSINVYAQDAQGVESKPVTVKMTVN